MPTFETQENALGYLQVLLPFKRFQAGWLARFAQEMFDVQNR